MGHVQASKVNNENTRTMNDIYLQLTIGHQNEVDNVLSRQRCSGIFIVKFE